MALAALIWAGLTSMACATLAASASAAEPVSAQSPVTTVDQSVTYTSADGKPRTVAFRIWYPAEGPAGPVPPVLISHGGAGAQNRQVGFGTLAREYVSNNYVVVVLNHAPSTDRQIHLVDRPRDVSRVLDFLAGYDMPEDFRGTLEVNNAGHVGHSYGAYTSHAVGGATFTQGMFRDERVKAIVPLSPQGFDQFGTTDDVRDISLPSENNSWRDVVVPAFNIHGDLEANGPVNDANRAEDWRSFPYARYRQRENKFLAVIAGADHDDFGGNGSTKPGIDRYVSVNSRLFFDRYLKNDMAVDPCSIGRVDLTPGSVSSAGSSACVVTTP